MVLIGQFVLTSILEELLTQHDMKTGSFLCMLQWSSQGKLWIQWGFLVQTNHSNQQWFLSLGRPQKMFVEYRWTEMTISRLYSQVKIGLAYIWWPSWVWGLIRCWDSSIWPSHDVQPGKNPNATYFRYHCSTAQVIACQYQAVSKKTYCMKDHIKQRLNCEIPVHGATSHCWVSARSRGSDIMLHTLSLYLFALHTNLA